MRTAYRRATRVLFGTLIVYALLVATHLGEFWPFSIYPMFSQAGNPWSRALVYEVPPDAEPLAWTAGDLESLPGEPFALEAHGIDPIDLANFVSKTQVWDADRVAALRQMFYDQADERRLLVVRANGRLGDGDEVHLEFVPYVLLGPDTSAVNPSLSSTTALRFGR